ncbi:hypothetical protein MUO14_17235 [Halobacillus shinanisalinarum]|uniref:Uncharacterized protein n=1 Tax=Halobacillus shinanisalinarum TaxID=2932258 RepID=A0ABY4GVL4_9BACI|nr:hypothetical protein [Halobacillus shinanisalinarum]UOQ92215.1 hypothetical protein MUO14_17235 [Halobacillus shinanisalinarum]
MITITFSLIFGLVVGAIVILTFVVPAFMAVKRNEKGPAPRKFSYGILGLLVINWLLFLTGSYALLPTNIADLIFIPVWLVLCVAGVIVAAYEFKNNKGFAIPVAGLTTISFLFSFLASGISKM